MHYAYAEHSEIGKYSSHWMVFNFFICEVMTFTLVIEVMLAV